LPTINRRGFNLGLLLGFAHAASARAATTQVITGDKGFSEQKLKGANFYDARGATVHVESGRNGYGFTITNTPSGAVFEGGRVIGEGINKTKTWAYVYSQGNGAALRATSVQNLTIRGLDGEFSFDFIKLPGCSGFTIEHCHSLHNRDDCIENDTYGSGVVRDNFFEGVHTFLSCNSSRVAPTKPWHIVWTGNVMSLGCGLPGALPCEDRAKRLKFAWACPTGSGQPWKVRPNNGLFTMEFSNNAAMIDSCINQTAANLKWFVDMKLTPASTGNRFYYLGSGKGLTMIDVTNPDGSMARVPAQFGIAPGPVWSRVSNSRTEWDAEIARWKATV
jgi:hypothetical protein